MAAIPGPHGRERVAPEVAHAEFEDLTAARAAVKYQRWILDAFGPAIHGHALEVGPGVGNFTRFLAERVDRITAVDPEPLMSEAITRLRLPNVTVAALSVEELALSGQRFDSALSLNVLEHVEDDGEMLRSTVSLVKPGGAIGILVPAHAALFGSLDRRYGHYRRYSRQQIRTLMLASDLDVLWCRYFNPVGALGWFLVARVLRSERVSLGAVRIAEHVGVPLGRSLERLGPPPFGQSVIALGVRRLT